MMLFHDPSRLMLVRLGGSAINGAERFERKQEGRRKKAGKLLRVS